MESRLIIVQRPVTPAELDGLDQRATVLVLDQAALEASNRETLDRLLQRRSMVIAIGGDLRDHGLAAALASDIVALRLGASILLRSDECPAAIAAALSWRIGRAALRLLIMNDSLDAEEAFAAGLCDVLVEHGIPSVDWVNGWLGARSLHALQSAAALLRLRGGDGTERAEFSRLFAAGVPQSGLSAFLEKRPQKFADERIVEIV